MNVNDIVAARIAAARRRTEEEQRRRTELAAARKTGLARRHAQKLRRLAEMGRAPVYDNSTISASGA